MNVCAWRREGIMGPGPGVFCWLEIGERRKILQSKLRNVRPEKKVEQCGVIKPRYENVPRRRI